MTRGIFPSLPILVVGERRVSLRRLGEIDLEDAPTRHAIYGSLRNRLVAFRTGLDFHQAFGTGWFSNDPTVGADEAAMVSRNRCPQAAIGAGRELGPHLDILAQQQHCPTVGAHIFAHTSVNSMLCAAPRTGHQLGRAHEVNDGPDYSTHNPQCGTNHHYGQDTHNYSTRLP